MKDIQISEGILVVRDTTNKDHYISELPMSAFESFYRAWTAVMLIGAQAEVLLGENVVDFAALYVSDGNFREQALSALRVIGFEDPANQLSPRQMKSLLFGHDLLDTQGEPVLNEDGRNIAGPGLVFQLHQTSPKVLTQAATNPTLGSENTSKGSASSIKHGLSALKRWVTSSCNSLCLLVPSYGLAHWSLTLV